MTVAEYNDCVDKHADGVYRFVLKCIGCQDKAQDVVQDCFEKMWVKRDGIDGGKAKSYLFSSAYHTLIDYKRRDSKMIKIDDLTVHGGVCRNEYTDIKEILDQGVTLLPEIQRTVLLLRDYEGYSYQEIGEITGLNESQVKVYIYRARSTLKNFIGSLEAII